MDIDVMQYRNNTLLTRFVVPYGTVSIGAKAFENCVNLKEISLPGSIRNIDMKAFHNCVSLEKISYAGSREDWEKVEISPVGTECLRSPDSAQNEQETLETAQSGVGDVYANICALLHHPDGGFHIIPADLIVPGVYGKTGDMTLLLFPNGCTMLIDTGYRANFPAVRTFLERTRIRSLDYMVFSHADPDHVTNARAIGEYLYAHGGRIGSFLWTGQRYGQTVEDFKIFLTKQNVPMDCSILSGREFVIDGVTVSILSPDREEIRLPAQDDSVRNNQSMVMKFTYGEASYLTAGDLYEVQEKKLTEKYGRKLKTSVLKTNHHGAYTSNSEEWIHATAPRFAFTENNDNGSSALAQLLQKNAIQYASTGWQGTMLISMYRDGCLKICSEYPLGERNLQRIALRPGLLICGSSG